MISGSNVPAKPSEKKMEGADKLRTLECLRGRLLAERGASRVANEEADQIASKLIELENQLRREVKSRDRAEKRLKSLIRKLESINIAYVVSDESENSNSSLLEKNEFSSVSSSSTTSSSYPKCPEDDDKEPIPNTQFTNSTKCKLEESMKEINPPSSEILEHNVTTTSSESLIVLPSNEKTQSDKSISEKSNDFECTQNLDDLKGDDHRSKSSIESLQKNDLEWDKSVDNSMALVLVDIPVTTQSTTTSPPISNASVKDVLDTLKYVRERLQSSMERRHMIEVGFR